MCTQFDQNPKLFCYMFLVNYKFSNDCKNILSADESLQSQQSSWKIISDVMFAIQLSKFGEALRTEYLIIIMC